MEGDAEGHEAVRRDELGGGGGGAVAEAAAGARGGGGRAGEGDVHAERKRPEGGLEEGLGASRGGGEKSL